MKHTRQILQRVLWVSILITLLQMTLYAQTGWKYSRITPSTFSNSPAGLGRQTNSAYKNIILHPNSNVDQSEMSITMNPTNRNNLIVGDNAPIQPAYLPGHHQMGYYYTMSQGIAGS